MARTTPRPVHVTDKAYMTQVHSYKLALNQNIHIILKFKLKQWWSTISPISTKQKQITFHPKSLNIILEIQVLV